MSLTVSVISASDLPNLPNVAASGTLDTIDPFVELTLRGEKHRTKHKSDNQNPKWNENFSFDLHGQALTGEDTLSGVVFDFETFGSKNRFVGDFTHNLRDVVHAKNEICSVQCKVRMKDGKRPGGKVNLEIKYTPPEGSLPLKEIPTVEGPDMEAEASRPTSSLTGNSVSPHVHGTSTAAKGGDVKRTLKDRQLLSKKPQNFVVRVKVWEARQLVGCHLHPLCKVSISSQTKATRVKKCTNRPFWNQDLNFTLNASPADLFDDIIKFQVFNSRGKLRSDAVIGSFLLDVGTIYEGKDHCIMNKWLALTNEDSSAAAGIAGYLLVSMSVIGKGDRSPQFKKALETDHIESNLLRPVGTEQQTGVLIIKIYYAEDIPPMDSDYFEKVKRWLNYAKKLKKDHVDPYLVVSFAGKEVKTDVIMGSNNPEWNEEFRLPITFPSMCERIKLQMRDWDGLTEHDCIGTTYIDMSSISSPGDDGFLPTFGPCFVNFYGATREFSHFPDKYDYLNEGKGTGVAYRGRVMMSIQMELGENPEDQQHQSQKINPKEVKRVRNLIGERYTYNHYRLYCAFLNATMVCQSDKPVEFEVSIGDFGNKLVKEEVEEGDIHSPKIKLKPSSTRPIRPLKNGEYCYMPWTTEEKKPVVVIDSEWEDVNFRLKLLNSFVKKVEHLQTRLDNAKMSIHCNKTEEAREELRKMIEELQSVCCSEAQTEKSDGLNDLDKAKYAQRKLIAADAEKMLEGFDNADVNEILNDLEELVNLLQEIAVEPQNSLPDVIIWMISGTKRIAFHRIPANQLLYSDNEDERGNLCNKIHSFFLEFPGTYLDNCGNIGTEKIGARLRVRLWLGLQTDAKGANIGVFQKMKEDEMLVPRHFLTTEKMSKYRLRIFLYQARNLLALDSDGLSDPFAQVSFLSHSKKSVVLNDTVCPVWNQQFIFDSIMIPGVPTEENLPQVCIEVFDSDNDALKESSEFLGRSLVPVVYNQNCNPNLDHLVWRTIYKGNNTAGELLVLCEIFPDSGHVNLPPLQVDMENTRVEILSWGIRNMKKYQLTAVTSPSIEFEINGRTIQSKVNRHIKVQPKFTDAVLIINSLDLPRNKLYMPSINIKVRDHRGFGRKPIVGSACITDSKPYIEELDESKDDDDEQVDATDVKQSEKRVETESTETTLTEDEIDWWSKYYASKEVLTKHAKAYLEMGLDKLIIYKGELEKVVGNDGFNDFCKTIKLYHGRQEDDEDRTAVGELKANFRIYPMPQDAGKTQRFTNLPLSIVETGKYIVRVYIVKGINLHPRDSSCLSDPYIKVQLGKTIISDEDHYIANNCNPVFGKMFEIKTTHLPLHKDLKVSVWDYDLLEFDDLIGETTIDLENRIMTKYRATCGLPQTYNESGPNKWRDSQTPKEILTEYCGKISDLNNKPLVKVDGKPYNLKDLVGAIESGEIEDTQAEQSALCALHKIGLVKEHIETRPIYSPLLPGIEQGKLEMFVDIFPMTCDHHHLPPPIDIAPRQHRKYVLRCVIWNVTGIKLDETTAFGETMSDIYVKGWLADPDEAQDTDVHYRSFDGTGNYNWRFVFPFEYNAQKKRIVVRKKEYFWSGDERETRELRPDLRIQVLEDDLISTDDWLGSLELQLDNMQLPSKKAANCGKEKSEKISLFKQKRVKGWWICKSKRAADAKESTDAKKKSKPIPPSMIEMTLEILTAEEAEQRPAGKGQEEPNSNPKLPPPERPATSFLWFLSPWKTLKFIIWRNLKWYIIGFLLVLFGIIGFLLFVIVFVVRLYLCK